MENLSIALCGPGDVGRELLQKTLDIPEFRYVLIADSNGAITKYANDDSGLIDLNYNRSLALKREDMGSGITIMIVLDFIKI